MTFWRKFSAKRLLFVSPGEQSITCTFSPRMGIAWLAILSVSLGCGLQTSENSPQQEVASATESATAAIHRIEVDAGVVFIDESSYICLPLEKLGLRPTDNISSVSTSCNCATPSVTEFRSGLDRYSKALRLDFKADPRAMIDHLPARVGMIVKIRLSSGEVHELTVNIVHTQSRNAVKSE